MDQTVQNGANDPALEAAAYRRLYPRKYLSRFLQENQRSDGRSIDAWRNVAINVGAISTANGSALVRLGDTTIICGIKAEIAQPNWDHPSEGWIVPNIDLPAICSPNYKPGPPADEAQVLSQRVHEILSACDVLPLKKLVIKRGKAAWVLYIDVVCINYDGNPLDAIVLAIMAALRHTTLPEASYDEDADETVCSRSARIQLRQYLRRLPLTCTFAVFDDKYTLPDPSAFETPMCPTLITVAIDSDENPPTEGKAKVRQILQYGVGGSQGKAGIEVVGECIGVARARVRELSRILYQ